MSHRSDRLLFGSLVAALAMAAGVRDGACVTYYLTTDVRATLAGIDYPSDAILRSIGATYSIEATLPAGTAVAALDRLPDGRWLIVPAHQQVLGGVESGPRDVLRFDGASFILVFDGEGAGIPSYARIDSLFVDAAGDAVFSFDVPVNLAGTEYAPSDLVKHHAGVFSLVWSANAAGVPAGANLVGAARDAAGMLVLSFDVPTNLGGTDYLPGELVAWTGTLFSTYFVDPFWPKSAQLRDFAFPSAAGAVPDGGLDPGTPLTVDLAGGTLSLSWGSSCAPGDSDYEVYEGALTTPFAYTHTAKLCTTGGATTAAFPAPLGSAYYLIVPKNAVSEGSYGRASSGTQVPQGTLACLPQQIASTCP